MEILGKFCDSPKLCVNCAFSQNFHTRKFGEITVFLAVNKKQALEAPNRNFKVFTLSLVTKMSFVNFNLVTFSTLKNFITKFADYAMHYFRKCIFIFTVRFFNVAFSEVALLIITPAIKVLLIR